MHDDLNGLDAVPPFSLSSPAPAPASSSILFILHDVMLVAIPLLICSISHSAVNSSPKKAQE